MKNKELTEKSGKIWGKLKKNKYVLIVILAGVFLLLLPTGNTTSGGTAAQNDAVSQPGEFSLSEQEERISLALSEIDGAGRVTVVLTLKSSEELVVATNSSDTSETSKDGGSSTESTRTTVIITVGSQSQTPVALKYIYPEYQGALIIAEGADSATVKLQLLQAVSGLTGLGLDKITVTKMKIS